MGRRAKATVGSKMVTGSLPEVLELAWANCPPGKGTAVRNETLRAIARRMGNQAGVQVGNLPAPVGQLIGADAATITGRNTTSAYLLLNR
jgi:hypothetical protein